ncbi:hypothetical protein QUB00_24930 [Microcoleus sp. F8_C2]
MSKLTWVVMRVGLELGDGDRIGEAVAVELLGVVTGGIDSLEEPLLGEGGKIGEEGAVELLGVVTGDDGGVEVPSPLDDGGVEVPSPLDDGGVEVPSPMGEGGVEVPSPMGEGGVEVPSPMGDGGVEVPSPLDDGGVEVPSPLDDSGVEVPSPMGEGGVSTPWISIPPAATGGEGRIGEEGAVELLGVVTCDIRFFGNKNYSRCMITAHQTNCSYAPKPIFKDLSLPLPGVRSLKAS